jgi:hypothetical protein
MKNRHYLIKLFLMIMLAYRNEIKQMISLVIKVFKNSDV